MNKSISIGSHQSAEDRFGRQFAALLDSSAQSLPHDISERLRIARQQALEKHRALQPVRSTAASVQAQANGTLALGGDDERHLWPGLSALIAIALVVLGLVMIHTSVGDQMAEDLAKVDSAILTDDLPPTAYSDPGFAEFLKAQASQVHAERE